MIPCDGCPVAAMCMWKEPLILVRECPRLNLHLTTQGRRVKEGQSVVVGIESLKMRFMVSQNGQGTIHIGYLECAIQVDPDIWYEVYGGNKHV